MPFTAQTEELIKEQQKAFVRELTDSISQSIIRSIEVGKIPEDWDGIELRQLMADKFKEAACSHLMNGKRGRDYRNHVLIINL